MNLIFVYNGGWSKAIQEDIVFQLVAGEMPNLKNLGALMNEDGTVGIHNQPRGCEIFTSMTLPNSVVARAKKFCPSCPPGVEQPTYHVVTIRKIGGVTYQCDVCGYFYYYLKNELFTFIPEAQMKYHVKDYVKKVNKKPYELHYLEAKECGWFENIDLNNTTIKEGVWTAVTEISAQIFHRSMSGHAPGYLMCEMLKIKEQNPIPNELGPQIQEAMAWLKQMEYM